MVQSRLILKYIDTFLKLLNDSNSKVAIHAITSFQELVLCLKVHIYIPLFKVIF